MKNTSAFYYIKLITMSLFSWLLMDYFQRAIFYAAPGFYCIFIL